MPQVYVRMQFLLLGTFLLVITGSCGMYHENSRHAHRMPREIRKGFREGRVLYHAPQEASDQRTMLLLRNPPREPPHDMYRKGFSYLHVPDFHRLPLEDRTPRRGNQSIDDIISGIIHLLGGDVHVKPTSAKPARVNNRGPAHFSSNASFPSATASIAESSTNRWVFPDDTDVSLILGLINKTESSSGSSEVRLQNATTLKTHDGSATAHIELVEIVPSSEYSTTSSTHLPSSFHGQIRPTQVLTELDKHGKTFIETVVTAAMPSYSTTSSSTSSHIAKPSPKPSSSQTILINFTEPPVVLPSISTDHSSSSMLKTQPVPTGPVTEWLPVGRFPEPSGNATASGLQEPVIITREPDNFEITVSRQMYNESDVHKVVPATTPPDVTSSTDISVSIVTTQVDIIYGRPSTTSAVAQQPRPPTGRPQVIAVDIGEVRPTMRPNINAYPRPRPKDNPRYGNGLRPAQLPRPGAGIQRKPPPPPVFRPPPLLPPPQLPEIRIDTCVVGDDSTCDVHLHEHCRTERGISACLCRPGFGRTRDRGLCTPVVSMLLTLKVAKMGDTNIDPSHFVPGSAEFQRLNYEASHAMATVFTYSPLADGFRGSQVNRVYFIAQRMVINGTVHLAESEVRGSLRHHVEHAVAAAIGRRNSQLGDSRLFVHGPLSALVEVEDLNECGDTNLNDCSEFAVCENLFGTFQCKCRPGYTDKSDADPRTAGRACSACSPDYCNGKGQCVVANGRQECKCRGNYGGARCQVDTEVIGVSVGVSVVALLVIAITARCLYVWNHRWKKAHQKSEAVKQQATYRLQTLADHVRWGPASPLGSTYVPSESTMQLAPAQMSASASQLYAISTVHPTRRHHHPHHQRNQLYEDDANPYGRIIRTIQKHNNAYSSGLHYDTLNSECASSDDIGCPSIPSDSFIYRGTFPERPLYR